MSLRSLSPSLIAMTILASVAPAAHATAQESRLVNTNWRATQNDCFVTEADFSRDSATIKYIDGRVLNYAWRIDGSTGYIDIGETTPGYFQVVGELDHDTLALVFLNANAEAATCDYHPVQQARIKMSWAADNPSCYIQFLDMESGPDPNKGTAGLMLLNAMEYSLTWTMHGSDIDFSDFPGDQDIARARGTYDAAHGILQLRYQDRVGNGQWTDESCTFHIRGSK